MSATPTRSTRTEKPRLLVVDDDPAAADLVGRHLRELDVEVVGASGGEAGITAARGRRFDVALVDFYMPDKGGLDVLAALQDLAPDTRVILTSGQEPSEVAIEAMRHGAFDFIGKPLSGGELRLRIERALRDRHGGRGDIRGAAVSAKVAQVKANLEATRPPPSGTAADLAKPAAGESRRPRKSDVIIGSGPWIKELYERISMVAPTDVTVSIFGESGTGKELVARTIHALSNRYERPFVVMNCGAIPEALLEDELFGHVRGSFTDASKDREGLFALADGGTLFLDEIGEMPPQLQVKLLRVLQSQEFRRIGDDHDIRVDVRVVTATNRDLEKAVRDGSFRQDLFYRINVFPLTLPPLRDRREDIPLLAHHFLLKHRQKVGKKVEGFTPGAMHKIVNYPWPGNVRELENRVHHALVLAQGDRLLPDDIPIDAPSGAAGTAIDVSRPFRDLKREVVDAFERDYARELLKAHHGNLAAAARQARVDRKNLWALLKKHGIEVKEFKA